jgi:hypothetical protein
LAAAVLRQCDGVPIDQSLWPLLPHRELALSAPEIRLTPLPDGRLEISSPVFCHAAHIEDHGHGIISDNWLDLLPNVPVRVRVAAGIDPAELHLEAIGPAPSISGD